MNDFRCYQNALSSANRLVGIVKHVSQEYTLAIFEEFYEELFESLLVAIEKASYDRIFHIYNLLKVIRIKEYVV